MRFPARARLGRYEILCPIGAGGMGEVYRALDTRQGRVVALKVLSKAWTADETRRAQLESEARAVSAISHPHICTLFDFDSEGGVPFLVMEYLAGETLEQRLQRGPLSIDDCLRHGIQLTKAVVAVHRAGIVHRDLKPANVMLTAAGVKLLDFGVAALLPAAHELTTSTGFDDILGTVPYMAPEQLRGDPPSCSADLYAIGAILHEMLSGVRPFAADRLEPLIGAILATLPPLLRNTRTDVPPALDRIIRTCLAKGPAGRHRSAAALLADLQRVRDAFREPGAGRQSGRPTVGSLAVLPFACLTSGGEVDFLAEGISELLTSALARLGSFRVISRTSVVRLNPDDRVRQIASQLHVDAVIEGSVAAAGDRIRVTARLIHAASDTHLWADTFERHFRDILSVQADLAEAIARGIQVSLTAEERAIVRGDPRQDVDGHLLYLRARFKWNHPTPEAFGESYRLFRQAIDADAAYAPAYAGLADWYHRAWLERVVPRDDALAEARKYAMQALSLDNRSAEAHASLANAAKFDWDFRAAEAGYRKALALCPSYAAAHLWYAHLKLIMADDESALAEIGLARACDPLSPAVLTVSGIIHHCGGRYADALADFRHAIELQDDYGAAHYRAGMALLEMGEYGRADRAFGVACRLRPNHPTALVGLAICRARRGDLSGARALEQRIQQLAADQASALSLAEFYTQLGEQDRALRHLEQAYEEREPELFGIAVDPVFLPLPTHPAFQGLLGRVGLSQSAQLPGRNSIGD